MILLVLSTVTCCALVSGCAFLVIVRQPKKDDREVVVVKEPIVNLMMPLLLILMCAALLGLRFAGLDIGGQGETSDRFVAGLALVCALGGCHGLLFSLLKQTLAYDDRMIILDLLGRANTIRWDEVTAVKTKPMSRRLVFYVGEESSAVNGEMDAYRKFVALANRRVPGVVASDTLGNLCIWLNENN